VGQRVRDTDGAQTDGAYYPALRPLEASGWWWWRRELDWTGRRARPRRRAAWHATCGSESWSLTARPHQKHCLLPAHGADQPFTRVGRQERACGLWTSGTHPTKCSVSNGSAQMAPECSFYEFFFTYSKFQKRKKKTRRR
jgi:hypothetical protein